MASSVVFDRRIVPSSAKERKPQGAPSSSSSIGSTAPAPSGGVGGVEILTDRLDRLLGMAHVRTVARGGQLPEGALRQAAVQVLAHRVRGDDVVGALQDERGDAQASEVLAVVGEEGGLRETTSDYRVGG